MRNAFAAALLLLSGAAQAFTADELVTKNLEAHGGLDKIHALKTLRLEGKLIFGGGFELRSVSLYKAPDKVRQEASLQGLTQVQAWDGKEAWQIQPFGGRKDPERLSADDAKGLADGADMVNGLVDWKARGSTVEYLGTEDVDGTDAHKLKLTRKNGDVTYYFLDPDYFLEIRSLDNRTVRGVMTESESDFGDYELVEGVYLPFSSAFGPKGSTQKAKAVIEKATANVSLDDAQFVFPSAAAK
jgi:hypothetical protein